MLPELESSSASSVQVIKDECPMAIRTPEAADGLAIDIQQETKRAVNKTYVRGRLTRWTKEHFDELGLTKFIQESDLAEILKATIKTTSDDCFREQKPVPRKTPTNTRSFFQPVMVKAFDLCSAEALEQCRNTNLSTGLKLLVCAVEFARIVGLEIPPALISCFREMQGKLTRGSELEKLFIQAKTLFPDLTVHPVAQTHPAATTHSPEDSLPGYDVETLICLSRTAVADEDWERVVVLQKEIIGKGPRDPVMARISLAIALEHTGRIAEAIEQRLEIRKLAGPDPRNEKLLAQLCRLTELGETHTVRQLWAMMNKAQQAQNFADVLSCAQRCLAIEPGLFMAHIRLIYALQNLGRFKEELEAREKLAALPNFQDKIENFERIKQLKIQLGMPETKTEHSPKSADSPAGIPDDYKDFDGDIVSLNMSDLIRFARQAGECGDNERAIEFRRRMIEIDPRYAINYIHLAVAFAGSNRYGEANEVLEKIKDPAVYITDLAIERWAAALRAKIDAQLATAESLGEIPAPKAAPLASQSEIQSLVDRASHAEAIQDWDSSIELRGQLICLNPDHPANYIFLSKSFEKMGAYAAALEAIETAVRLRTYRKDTSGDTLRRIKKLRTLASLEARETEPTATMPATPDYKVPTFYKDVTETDLPHLSVNDLILFSMQAQSVKNGYDHKSAIVFLEERLRRDPNSRSTLMNLQHSYKQLERYREALEILEKLRNHRTIRGNQEKEGMIDEKIADMRSHIEAEEARQQRRTDVKLEKPVQQIFFSDLLSRLYDQVKTWPTAENIGRGWHTVPVHEKDVLEKTLVVCRQTLQHNRMLPVGKPGDKKLASTIKDVRKGYINTCVLECLMAVAGGGMPGRVVIDLDRVKVY